jgi:membrane protease YdiL (CAAX protease family)
MQNILRNTPNSGMSPWLFLMIVGGYVFAGLIGFQFIAPLFAIPFYEFDVMKTFEVISHPADYESSRIPLLMVQGVISIGTFILIPWWIIKKYLKIPLAEFFSTDIQSQLPLVLTIAIVFVFMGVNSFFIEWNMGMQLPESMSAIEEKIRSMEDQLKILTEHLIQFDNAGHFLLGLLVIAVVPAVGEELLFRGLIQNTFFKIMKNPHAAIWFSAFLFSVFHMQFYGVVPRILLGALFGYLYYFSGHLGYAMLAHFVNNGFMITMVYLSQIGVIDYDMDSMDTSPEIWAVLLFGIATTGLIFVFYRYFENQKNGLSENL